MEREMKTRKLLDKLMAYLDSDARKRKKERDEIKAVLKKLKRREKKLKNQLDDLKDDGERAALQKEIDIVHAQRKKGVRLLKEE
jgi:predicted  nucleic acid-binding Zn-ribbon protein